MATLCDAGPSTANRIDRDAVTRNQTWECTHPQSSGPLKVDGGVPVAIDLLPLPGFDIHDLSALLDTFHLANGLAHRRPFTWHIVGLQQRQVRSSTGLVIATDCLLSDIGRSDNIFILSGYDQPYAPIALLETWLKQQLWYGAYLGTIGSGSDLLAEMGLLCNRSCAAHWAHIDAYRRRHLHMNFQNQVYHFDQGVVSCGGGCATTDLALACVRQICGGQFSLDIADRLNRHRVRDEHDIQGRSTTNAIVGQAARLMQQHLEAPLRGEEIARRLGISLRRLQRVFQRHEGVTPSQFYSRQRLLKSRGLVRHTLLPISVIADRCGFSSASDFARNYAQLFGRPPSQDR